MFICSSTTLSFISDYFNIANYRINYLCYSNDLQKMITKTTIEFEVRIHITVNQK